MPESNGSYRALRTAVLMLGVVAAARATAADAGDVGERERGAAVLAVVTDLAGRGQLLHAGAGRPLVILDTLAPRDALRLERGATLEVAYLQGDASVWRLRGPGRFRIEAAGVQTNDATASVERRDLAAMWRNLRIRTDLAGRASIALRGSVTTQVRLRAPLGGVSGDAPIVLEWDPPYGRHEGAWAYTVRVIDDQGSLVYARPEAENALTLPQDLPMERSRDYLWTVQASDSQRRRAYGAAQFHVLAPEEQARMDALRQAVVGLRRDPARVEASAEEGLLVLAMEAAGLHGAAQRQLRALAAARPAWSPDIAADP